MCKINSPHKYEASTGCVRETPQIKKERKTKEKEKSQHGMCKRNSPQKNKASAGCVRETPR